MMRKKSMISGLLILLSITMLTSCGGAAMPSEEARAETPAEKALKDFSQQIEEGNLGELSLTIYYVNPNAYYFGPWSVEDLIYVHDYKIVVDGTRLEEHIDLLKQMSNAALMSVEHENNLDARIYYVFETKQGEKILDVAMWGYDSGIDLSIYINGFEVKANNIFFDVLIPFLPEDMVNIFKIFISYDEQT